MHKANLVANLLAKEAINKIDVFIKNLWNLGKTQNSFSLELLFLKLLSSVHSVLSPTCFLQASALREAQPQPGWHSAHPLVPEENIPGSVWSCVWGSGDRLLFEPELGICVCPLLFLGKGQWCLLICLPGATGLCCHLPAESFANRPYRWGAEMCFFQPEADL